MTPVNQKYIIRKLFYFLHYTVAQTYAYFALTVPSLTAINFSNNNSDEIARKKTNLKHIAKIV